MKLRDYQRAAVDALYDVWAKGIMKNPLIVAPTGAGKSPILGTLSAEVTTHPDSRVIVLTHRSELIKQDKRAIEAFTKEKVGIYSAQLKRKDRKTRILVAGINSIYKKATDFDPFDICIIDECHLLSRNQKSMYQRFLQEAWLVNPKMKLVGLSATPYRLDSGYLYIGKDAMFDGIAYEIGVKFLIDNGYLSPIVSKSGAKKIDLTNVHKRGGEFIASELAVAADTDVLVDLATNEIIEYGQDRRAWLLFCAGVEHANHVAQAIESKGYKCAVVTGETPPEEREFIFGQFERGEIKAIANCQVLTTGFDAPYIDLVALLTATESTGLYIQMVGRGTRISQGKNNCLLLDYGGNVERHGVFDEAKPKNKSAGSGDGQAPAKVCPSCMEVVATATQNCPQCGHEFPPREISHDVVAYDGAVMADQIKPQALDVQKVEYAIHRKAGKPPSIRIDYHCGWLVRHSEWVCPEHKGYARTKYEQRCQQEWGITPAGDCIEFMKLAAGLPTPKQIVIKPKPGSRYEEIVKRSY